MTNDLTTILYLLSGVLFILAIRGLSSPDTARTGNYLGISGMAIAFIVTIVNLDQNNLINSLSKRESSYKKQINDKQKQALLLDKEIDRLIKEAIRESNKNSSSTIFSLTPEGKALAESFSNNKGNLPWPVERGIVIQKFGLQTHPVVRTTKIKSNGIVIATNENANVRTVFKGKVLSILKFKGSNLTVLIQHGNYISVYKNLSKVYVNKGQDVESLEIIGQVFSNNSDSKTTLQFSIFNNTTALDPYLWIAN